MKISLKVFLKIVVSLVLIFYLFTTLDLNKTWSILINSSWLWVGISILLIMLNYFFSAIRWKMLVLEEFKEKVENRNDLSTFSFVKLYFIGSFFNNFLPTSIGGDAYKILALGEILKSKTHAFSATFLERFLGMLSLIIFSVLGMLTFQSLDLIVFVVFIVIGISSFVLFLMYYPKYSFKISRFTKIHNLMNSIHSSLRQYQKYPKILLFSFLLSFLVQVASIMSQYSLFLALGIFLPLDFSFLAFPLIFLSGYALPSINGIGTQDYLYTQMFSIINIGFEISLASSLLFHFARVFVSILGGLLYLFSTNSGVRFFKK